MEELTKLLLTQPPTNNNDQILNIHKTLSTTTIKTLDDDQHILEQLRQHAKLAQSNFDAIDTQVSPSSITASPCTHLTQSKLLQKKIAYRFLAKGAETNQRSAG